MSSADYEARLEQLHIPSGADWNARYLQALDDNGLMLATRWDCANNDDRYPWPGTPIHAFWPIPNDGPTWPKGSYMVYKT